MKPSTLPFLLASVLLLAAFASAAQKVTTTADNNFDFKSAKPICLGPKPHHHPSGQPTFEQGPLADIVLARKAFID
jgi:hypothetical protein